MSAAALEIAGLSKDYRGLRPLRIQQLTVGAEDSVAILGFDQASAEVFVNLVTGATLPDAGVVHVFGQPTTAIADGTEWLQTLDRFGIVTERAVLLDQLTVVQNLAMPFTLEIEPPPDEVKRQASVLAHEVGLPESIWEQPIAALPPASRVRLRLGRGLALDPHVLILEHVSAGLSAEEGAALGADVRAIGRRRGTAIVAATLDEAFSRAVADRILRWHPATGQLAEQGTGRWFRRLLG